MVVVGVLLMLMIVVVIVIMVEVIAAVITVLEIHEPHPFFFCLLVFCRLAQNPTNACNFLPASQPWLQDAAGDFSTALQVVKSEWH